MTLQALPSSASRRSPRRGLARPRRAGVPLPGEADVEGDWSAAAFWLAANALGARIDVEGLRPDSVQGDRAVAHLLGQAAIDATHVPDLVPALAVAAAALDQRTVITGAARLRLKESDRLAAVSDMIRALGHGRGTPDDGLIIDGGARSLRRHGGRARRPPHRHGRGDPGHRGGGPRHRHRFGGRGQVLPRIL